MSGTLAGVTLVVTRPAAQAGRFIERASAAGARCIAFPTLEIEMLPVDAASRVDLRARRWDWAIFTSTNSVAGLLPHWPPPIAAHHAAVGRATARALEAHGVRVEAVPDGATSEGLLALPPFVEPRGLHVLLVKGTGGRDVLQRELDTRGAHVVALEVYRRTRVTPSLAALAELEAAVRAPTRPVVAATSAEVLEALIESLPPALLEGVRASTLLVPGARVASRAQALGWHGRVVMSATAEDESMLATLTQALAGKSPPGP